MRGRALAGACHPSVGSAPTGTVCRSCHTANASRMPRLQRRIPRFDAHCRQARYRILGLSPRPAQHSGPAKRSIPARPHPLSRPASMRQEFPGLCPCYCGGPLSRLVAVTTGSVTAADFRAAADPTETWHILFRWDVSPRLTTCHEADRTLTDVCKKRGTTHDRAIPT